MRVKIPTGILLLLSMGVIAQDVADFQPERDGGWRPKAEQRNGENILTEKTARITSERIFEVDPGATYRLSGKFRSTGGDSESKTLFFGVEALDSAGRVIASPMVYIIPGTETELAAELKRGDQAAIVKDASKWDAKSKARVIAFGAKENLADLPNRTYSPNIQSLESSGGVWKITLQRPSPAGYPAGTKIRQHSHGMGRTYFAANYAKLQGGQWREFSGTISGIAPSGAGRNKWWKGTVKGRIILNGTPGIAFKDIRLEKIGGTVRLAETRPVKQSDPVRERAGRCLAELKAHPFPRPRLLFTASMFEEMRRALKENPLLKEGFEKLLKKVDAYPEEISEKTYEKQFYGSDKFGPTAMRAAFAFRLTGEKKYADQARKILKYASEWYPQQYAQDKAIAWTSFSRISALCAYDWLYEEMSPEERNAIGGKLLEHVKKAQDTAWIVKSGLQNKGEGTSAWYSSFYGTPLLKFYAGVVFSKAGIDDSAADRLLREGLLDHLRMLNHRSGMAGDDGGGNNSTPGYAFGDAPVCEWLFYTAWKALTGRNIASDFPANGLLPHWLFYATFPGMDGSLLEHGSGGSWHIDNKVKINLRYLALYRHFFPDHPAGKLTDYFISTQNEFKNDPYIYLSGTWSYAGYFPWLPFLYHYTRQSDYRQDKTFFASFPNAYFFRNLGQTYMFSGREKDSTYAMFTCGAKSAAHKQPDENHFVIYKGGFLAMDSGTRSASGWKDWLDDMWHDNNYYAASIAHNVVTIRMEGETFPGWPDRKYAVANHGGMYKTTGGVVQAYETNDIFTYIAGNSTACYRPEKCRKMIRQFVFVLPDYFVVCDTVESVRDDQAKTWLLHSQNEPVENGDIFRFEEGKGRLFCRTFLPENYRRTKIGGPGKEFWVDGKNYPQGKTRMEEYRKKGITNPLWGNWRMEIAPGEKCTKVRFLNLIQVGMKDQLREMTAAEYRKEGTSEGVRFETEKGTFTVLFDSDGSGGKIRAEKNGKVFLDQELTRKIQPQKAFQK